MLPQPRNKCLSPPRLGPTWLAYRHTTSPQPSTSFSRLTFENTQLVQRDGRPHILRTQFGSGGGSGSDDNDGRDNGGDRGVATPMKVSNDIDIGGGDSGRGGSEGSGGSATDINSGDGGGDIGRGGSERRSRRGDGASEWIYGGRAVEETGVAVVAAA